jgi:hypothetical protein
MICFGLIADQRSRPVEQPRFRFKSPAVLADRWSVGRMFDTAGASARAPWWTRPSRRFPLLLVVLAGVAWYGIPRVGRSQASGHAVRCVRHVVSEPRSSRLDEQFYVWESSTSGTWGRTDPCDGGWHRVGHRPPGGGYWPNGSYVDIDCARGGGGYTVRWNGSPQVWSVWLHVRGGEWLPAIEASAIARDAYAGLPTC